MMAGFALQVFALFALRQQVADDELPLSVYTVIAVVALMLPVLGAIPARAWWTLRKGLPSARRWTIAASIMNLLILLPVVEGQIHLASTAIWLVYAICGALGVLGLIAVWRFESDPDRPQPVQISGDGTSKLKDWIAQGSSTGIVSLSLGWWTKWATFHHLVYPDMIPFIAQMQLAVLLTTFGHELGHLVAGWASRKTLRSFQVGPFQWRIRNGEWNFEFDLRKFYGGSVGMVTPDLVNVRSRKAFSLIGGPVASLLIGSIFMVVALETPGHAWERYWMFLCMLATFSISAFLVNMIPLKPESNYSDGAQLYQIVTNGPWARVHFAFAMVTTSLVTPVRPRDFDVDVLRRAADSVASGERGLLLRLFACLHYLDQNRIPEAVAAMEEAEALYPDSKFDRPGDICAEFVFVNAFYKRDLAAADMWWQRLEDSPKLDFDVDYWRAQTARLWLKGESAEAREAWEQGNALAQKLPAAGNYEFTRSCFAKLRAALDTPVRIDSWKVLAAR
jgi:hypothetical protein